MSAENCSKEDTMLFASRVGDRPNGDPSMGIAMIRADHEDSTCYTMTPGEEHFV